MQFFPDSWAPVFALQTPLLELIVRGTVLYFGILIFLRILPRRVGGELAVMDLVFLFLIAEAASNALGDYSSVTEGLIVIATLMMWDYTLNFLSFNVRFIERLLSAPPLQVVRDGRMLRRNMRRELITDDELMTHLREQGVEDLKKVKEAFVESEGKITVICYEQDKK